MRRQADRPLFAETIPIQQLAIIKADRHLASGRNGECGNRYIETRQFAGPHLSLGGNGIKPFAGCEQQGVFIDDQIVRPGHLGNEIGFIQRRVRLQRPVHRRNGDGLTAKEIEDRIEDHNRCPQYEPIPVQLGSAPCT